MIYNKLNELIQSAMHEGNKDLLNTLRLIKAELLKAEKDGNIINEQSETKILLKMITQREDSIKQYIAAGRQELANKEQLEIDIINRYVPKLPSEEEIREYVKSILDIGKQDGSKWEMKDMKSLIELVKTKYDSPTLGKIISIELKNHI